MRGPPIAVAALVIRPAAVASNTKKPTPHSVDMIASIEARSIPLAYRAPLSQYWNVKRAIPIRTFGGVGSVGSPPLLSPPGAVRSAASRPTYSHPMRKPASPNSGGTH